MPIHPIVLGYNPGKDLFNEYRDKQSVSVPAPILRNLRQYQIWHAGMAMSCSVEQNPGALNKKTTYIRDYDLFEPQNKMIPVRKKTNATFRYHLSGRQKDTVRFVRQNLTTDPDAAKQTQISSIKDWWDRVGLHYDCRPNRLFSANNVGFRKEDNRQKLSNIFGEITVEDEEFFRRGNMQVLPNAQIYRFASISDLLNCGQSKLNVTESDLHMIHEAVCKHHYGDAFGKPGYIPLQIMGVPGYNGFGESLVIDTMPESEFLDAKMIYKQFSKGLEPTDSVKKAIWDRDGHECVCGSLCVGLDYGAEFATLLSPLMEFNLSKVGPESRQIAIKRIQNTQVSLEHLIPRKVFENHATTKNMHHPGNLLTACCFCNGNNNRFGQKSLSEKLSMMSCYGMLRGDGASPEQIANELVSVDFGYDINRYVRKECIQWTK